MANDQTNPNNVVIVPGQPNMPGTSTGTAGAPLSQGRSVNFGNIGQLPTRPTPITPVRAPRGRR